MRKKKRLIDRKPRNESAPKHTKNLISVYQISAEISSKLWHFCEKNLVVKEFEYECT